MHAKEKVSKLDRFKLSESSDAENLVDKATAITKEDFNSDLDVYTNNDKDNDFNN